jgi:t-SNARE complex subunit (syntaxin)
VAEPRESDLLKIADKVAADAGAIERCATHPHITVDCLDDDAAAQAYALGETYGQRDKAVRFARVRRRRRLRCLS